MLTFKKLVNSYSIIPQHNASREEKIDYIGESWTCSNLHKSNKLPTTLLSIAYRCKNISFSIKPLDNNEMKKLQASEIFSKDKNNQWSLQHRGYLEEMNLNS